MTKLAEKECLECKGHTEALKGKAIKELAGELSKGWTVIKSHHLEKQYKFKNFKDALAFTNEVGDLAEEVGHHPDIYLAWGLVKLTLWTHSVDGLTEGDFIFAAKVDELRK